MANITSITFNSIHSIIIAKLKTSSRQNSAIIAYKVDLGSDSNIMSCHSFKIVFSRASQELLAATKNKKVSYLKPTTKQQFHN